MHDNELTDLVRMSTFFFFVIWIVVMLYVGNYLHFPSFHLIYCSGDSFKAHSVFFLVLIVVSLRLQKHSGSIVRSITLRLKWVTYV